jgi:hypothetical protein
MAAFNQKTGRLGEKSPTLHSLAALFSPFGRKRKNRRPPARRRATSLSMECLERRELMATFAVTSTADSGAGTLRWAIEQANASAGADTIAFDLRSSAGNAFEDVDAHMAGGDTEADVFVIRPLTALPSLTDTTGGTWINGRSQTTAGGDLNPFGPEVVLDGSRITADSVNGLQIWFSNRNRIDGLVIQNFNGQGVSIVGGDDNVVSGNYIGTDGTGTQARGNGRTSRASAGGIMLSAGAERNLIGTDADGVGDVAERNLISGNFRHGIRIQQGSLDHVTRDNIIRGNYIGTDANGRDVSGLGNQTYAVEYLSHASDGMVGNVITDNIVAGNGRGDVNYAGATSPERNIWLGNGQLFATASFANGVLSVRGTEAADHISIYQQGESVFVLEFNRSANLLTIPAAQLRSIIVEAGGGNDVVDIGGRTRPSANLRPLTVPATVNGGAGTDIIYGANGNDTLRGGSGNDYVYGGSGNDRLVAGDTITAYEGNQSVLAMMPYKGGMLTAFSSGWVYYTPNAQSMLGDGTNIIRRYTGNQTVVSMIPYRDGVITAFSSGWEYYSPDGLNLGGGGSTTHAYRGPNKVLSMTPYGTGVLTVMSDGKIYYSADGQNLGSATGNTVEVGQTTQWVTTIVPVAVQRPVLLQPYAGGVLAAFDWLGGSEVFFSPDGRNLNGGGRTVRVYAGRASVVSMTPYSGGVMTAFSDKGVFFSPDGQNLHGGGRTFQTYFGTQRVTSMTPYRGGLLTAFSGGGIYFSPDGRSLVVSRMHASNGPVPTLLRTYSNGVITRFSDNRIFFTPDGVDFGPDPHAAVDQMFGELGDDVLTGNVRRDHLYGDDGVLANDRLAGSDIDTLRGRDGDDFLYGGPGTDHLLGDEGGDTLHGGTGWDTLLGGAGSDKLYGESGLDTLSGEGGADFLDGGAENDDMFGGDDDDTLIGGTGVDSMDGGSGYDTLYDNDLAEMSNGEYVWATTLDSGYPQNDGWSCGPNSATRFLRHYGYNVTYGQMKDLGRDAVTFINIRIPIPFLPDIRIKVGLDDLGLGMPPPALRDILQQFKPDVNLEVGTSFERVLELIGQGKPVIALLKVGDVEIIPRLEAAPKLHYVVLNGFDLATQTIFYTNTNGSRQSMSFNEFNRQWDWSDGGITGAALRAANVHRRTIIA